MGPLKDVDFKELELAQTQDQDKNLELSNLITVSGSKSVDIVDAANGNISHSGDFDPI